VSELLKKQFDGVLFWPILSHMANLSRPPLDHAFFALDDATRRGMLVRLSRGETSVSEFASDFGVSLPTIHKHLRVLERAGFISHEKRGRVRHVWLAHSRGRKCSGNQAPDFSPLRAVKDWVTQFEAQWDKHLLRLKQQVEADL
jgi:DNA-binding transcriptional ArsR family regulator